MDDDILVGNERGGESDARIPPDVTGTATSPSAERPDSIEPPDPLVSVVLSSHNYARYLRDSIESVLAQTYQKFELIIIDDGSTDESPRIIEEFAGLHPERIHAITSSKNRGLTRSYNDGLARASGAIVAGISSDDVWAPTALETWVSFFGSHPEVDLLATDFNVIGPDGVVRTGQSRLDICPQFERYFEADFSSLYEQLLRGNFLPDVAIATSLRRISLNELFYDERCPLVSDWELYLRMANSHRWAYLPMVTVLYRWHGQNMSSPQKSLERRGEVLGQHLYVLGKQLVSTQAMDHRTIILEQLGRFWSDYTALLMDAGIPNVTQVPVGVVANELANLRQRATHLEEERTKQRARAEALQERVGVLEEERAKQQARAEALEDRTHSLAEQVGRLEQANSQRRSRRPRWLTGLRRRLGNGAFDHQGLFDAEWYLAAYPDVKANGVDPFKHYVRFGAAEGRDPSPAFDTDFYLASYPDVAAAGLNPLDHYIRFGRQEGRNPSDPDRLSR